MSVKNNVDNHNRDFKNHPSNTNNRYLLSYNEIPEYEIENHNAYIECHILKDNDFSNNINGVCSTIDSLAKVHKKYFKKNDNIKEYVILLFEIHSVILYILFSSTLNGKHTET